MIIYLDSEKYKHQSEWYEEALRIYQLLPKHSESFGDWLLTQTEHSLRFKGRYFLSEWTQRPSHAIDFTLILSKDVEKPIKIQFNGKKSQDLCRRFRIRSYLESEMIESLYGGNTGVEHMIEAGFFDGLED